MKLLKKVAIPVIAVAVASLLFLSESNPVYAAEATQPGVDGGLDAAIDAAKPGEVVQLTQNVAEALTVSKNIILDLNGYSISGTVTAANGYTLTVKDSATDDFSAADGYGKINTQGNVQAAEGYVAITEEDGTSYHRLDLQLKSVSLRPGAAGIYYSGNFGGDEIIKEKIDTYGTILSVYALPTEAEFKADNYQGSHTAFAAESWVCGQTCKANGTLLSGVLKQDNTPGENAENSQCKIYSVSYVQLKDGAVVFGAPVTVNLQTLVETIDTKFSALWLPQSDSLLEMYRTYKSLMDHWEIPNLKAAAICDHVWDSGTVTTPATVYTEGTMLHVCLNCSCQKEEIIPVIPSFTVTFYNADNRIISTNKYALGTAAAEIKLPSLQGEDGYAFKAWTDAISGNEIGEIDFASVAESSVFRFKPVFTKVFEISFVYYDENGQLTETVLSMEENQIIRSSDLPEIPPRKGYTAKWDETIVGTKVTGNLTFSPVYEVLTYTVTFLDAQNGSQLADPQIVNHGSFAVVPNCDRYYFDSVAEKMYRFTGWKALETGDRSYYANGNKIADIACNLTLYPVYEDSITAPMIAVHIGDKIDNRQKVTLSLCMPGNSSLYSINMSIGWATATGISSIESATVANTTSLNPTQCSNENNQVHISKDKWLTYNNKTHTFDFVWGCGNGHSFVTDSNLITLVIGVNNQAILNEESFSVLAGSTIVYGESDGAIGDAESAPIMIWFY